ncbi:hypothetical protein FRB90_007190 [Tulasnella sp. 427]|nr:hypothetical protein FRB90_007190 [Tulasnella sp. 427]
MSFQVRMSGPDLKAAYNAVRDGDPDTEWVIYTYLNNGGDLVVQETGAGGLQTLCPKFSPTRVQHVFARVEDPRMHGDKFILVHWCGDDAPAGPRRFFAINSGVIGSFLKGAQVTFTASDEHDITPEAIMKRLIGQGTASEVPRAPARSMFRRATESYRAPQRVNSSFVPVEKPVQVNPTPVVRPKVPSPAPEATFSHILTEEPEEMGDPFDDPVVVHHEPAPVPAPAPAPAPILRTPPPAANTISAPPAYRSTNTRGLTWGERLAEKRRQETIDQERSQQAMQNNVVRLNTINDAPPTLTWSQRQALSKQKADEEERARLAELEFQENERKLRELEERVRAEKEALEAELARQEEEERFIREEQERRMWEEQQRQDQLDRQREEQRQREEMERKMEELRRFEQIKTERKRQEELAQQLERERQERERHEMLARQMEEEKERETRKRQEDLERLEAQLRQMEELRVAAEAKEQALRAEAARREREAEEQLQLAQLRLRQAEEERLAFMRAKEEEEEARRREEEDLKRAEADRKAKLEREERDRKLADERLHAEKREADTIRAAEIQRLTQRVRELELRREASAIEERAAKLRQEQERKKRLELEQIAQREREEKERLLAREQEEEARRLEEEEARFREYEELHNRVMEMERLALQEAAAREKAAAAEKEARQRLRQAEERTNRLLTEKETMLRKQQEEQARIRAAAQELARRRQESEAEAQLSAPESMSTAVDLNGEDAGSGSDKKRRVALPKRQPGGWTPLQGNSGFSFERAARTLGRVSSDSPRESSPYLKNAAKDLSSFFVVDYGTKPQGDFVIPLPHH